MANGPRKLTEDDYNKIIEAFRQHPNQPYLAAKLAGVDGRTANRAWERGWPKNGWEPVKVVLEREKLKARADMLNRTAVQRATLEKEREDAIKQASQSRAQEGQMVGLARTGALQALAVASQLIASGRQLATLAKRKIEEEALRPDGDDKQLTAVKSVDLLGKIVSLQAQINSLAHEAMEMERLHLGEPTASINVVHHTTEMSYEELETRLTSARDALSTVVEARSSLKALPPSSPAPVIGKRVVTH